MLYLAHLKQNFMELVVFHLFSANKANRTANNVSVNTKLRSSHRHEAHWHLALLPV